MLRITHFQAIANGPAWGCPRRRAFTLIEVLVVVSVIAALAGMAMLVLGKLRRDGATGATRALVASVAATIAASPDRHLTVAADAGGRWKEGVRRLWDFDGRGFLDGDPARDQRPGGDPDPDPGFSATDQAMAAAAGYRGFLNRTGFSAPASAVDGRGRLVDAWRHPLRLAFAEGIYGPAGFGLWSAGPDGSDGTADDLTSWKDAP